MTYATSLVALQVPRGAEVAERATGLRVHDDEVVLVAARHEAVGGSLLVGRRPRPWNERTTGTGVVPFQFAGRCTSANRGLPPTLRSMRCRPACVVSVQRGFVGLVVPMGSDAAVLPLLEHAANPLTSKPASTTRTIPRRIRGTLEADRHDRVGGLDGQVSSGSGWAL